MKQQNFMESELLAEFLCLHFSFIAEMLPSLEDMTICHSVVYIRFYCSISPPCTVNQNQTEEGERHSASVPKCSQVLERNRRLRSSYSYYLLSLSLHTVVARNVLQ